MDDRHTVLVDDNAHLQRDASRGRTDEHRHVGIVRLERSPVVLEGVSHVVIWDTVLTSMRIDVHDVSVRGDGTNVNRC